jgi:hypothetical protein
MAALLLHLATPPGLAIIRFAEDQQTLEHVQFVEAGGLVPEGTDVCCDCDGTGRNLAFADEGKSLYLACSTTKTTSGSDSIEFAGALFELNAAGLSN